MLLNIDQVKDYLPHREPFLFIDSVESISGVENFATMEPVANDKDLLGTEVVAKFHVRADLDFFRGHFPNRPVLPGVIQIEMMAQASCFAVIRLHKDSSKTKSVQVAFGKVENAKFRKPVYPGQDLLLCAKLVKIRGEVVGLDCEIKDAAGSVFAQCSILATISLHGDKK